TAERNYQGCSGMALAHSRRPSMAGLWGALKQCPRVCHESPMGDSFKNCPHPGGQYRYKPSPNIPLSIPGNANQKVE
ncbi:MAG: hypothetical protein U9P37_07020, partial [Pseudomonadota bacterium]|nr:hypothetical protein [Pseudomonadota bacterium]